MNPPDDHAAGRVGVPPAVLRVPRSTPSDDPLSQRKNTSECIPQDAEHGGRDAHPTRIHDTAAPHLAAYAPEASAAQQRDFLTNLYRTLNAPSHPIRNRLLRISADSPELLGVIKAEGMV